MVQFVLTVYKDSKRKYFYPFCAKTASAFTGVKYLYITMPVFFSDKTKEGL
jgi:hypothetical protein